LSITRGGLGVNFSGRAGELSLTAALEREAGERRRLVMLRDASGQTARLDFSAEPGTITIHSKSRNADPDWAGRQSPLALQLGNFLDQADSTEDDLAAILQTASFCAALAEAVRAAQRQALARPQDDEAVLTVLRELLAPHLARAGLLAPGDNQGLDHQVEKALAGDAALAGVVSAAGLSPQLLVGIPKSHTPGN
jgi:hypothetical protein